MPGVLGPLPKALIIYMYAMHVNDMSILRILVTISCPVYNVYYTAVTQQMDNVALIVYWRWQMSKWAIVAVDCVAVDCGRDVF